MLILPVIAILAAVLQDLSFKLYYDHQHNTNFAIPSLGHPIPCAIVDYQPEQIQFRQIHPYYCPIITQKIEGNINGTFCWGFNPDTCGKISAFQNLPVTEFDLAKVTAPLITIFAVSSITFLALIVYPLVNC